VREEREEKNTNAKGKRKERKHKRKGKLRETRDEGKSRKSSPVRRGKVLFHSVKPRGDRIRKKGPRGKVSRGKRPDAR